jgi:hypothetical protein
LLSPELEYGILDLLQDCKKDWCLFAKEVLGADLDPEQQAILKAVQQHKKISVKSGTARGKDFVAAVAALCFLYLTAGFDEAGNLIDNTKVILTAPTDRQVKKIMMPEIARLHKRMVTNGFAFLAGKLNVYEIKTDYEEWFLVGFKADENKTEAWSGQHAANILFVVTEASGIGETIYNAIEGNLQGNSRLLIVFNDNTGTGYAAASQKKAGWQKFRLDSLTAPNVLQKKIIIPGQVDWEWVNERVRDWCQLINPKDFKEDEGDFWWENNTGKFCYRPNDLFRVKVRGMAPKVSADVLIPESWIEAAQERYLEFKKKGGIVKNPLRLGVDVAGMGRDSSVFCPRYGWLVNPMEKIQSAGNADHMRVAGTVIAKVKKVGIGLIDTIGEGAGVYSACIEKGANVYSVKASHKAEWRGRELKDATGEHTFFNMRAYLHWAVRDWLDPAKESKAMLPPDDEFLEEATEIKWFFTSKGQIQIEAKEGKDGLVARLGRSPDKWDSLTNTFHPVPDGVRHGSNKKIIAQL